MKEWTDKRQKLAQAALQSETLAKYLTARHHVNGYAENFGNFGKSSSGF